MYGPQTKDERLTKRGGIVEVKRPQKKTLVLQ
jgi:hypothetical protein